MVRTFLWASVLLVCAAGPLAAADMTEEQKAAYDRLLPLMQAQLEGDGAGFLAECVVEDASSRELKRLGLGEIDAPDPKMLDTANKIMTRPAVMTCLTGKLTK